MHNLQTTRRDLLKMAGVGAGVAALGLKFRNDVFAQEPAPLRVRRNIADLEPDGPEVTAYRAGVAAMRARANTDNTGWSRQALIHQNNCPHGNWYFLPWHRAYIYYFEEICREASGDADFALPYWNWTTSRALPGAFWGAGNPLRDTTRNITPASQASVFSVGQPVIDGILDISDFQTFASFRPTPNVQRPPGPRQYGQLEGTPHNYIHGFVGGNMATFLSPLDPCFWCHHANIDRLWADWNELGNANGFDQPTLDYNFANNFYDVNGNPIANVTVAEQMSTYALGYRYDTQFAINPEAVATIEAAPPAPVVAEAAANAVTSQGVTASIPISLPGNLRERLATVARTSPFDIQAAGDRRPTVSLDLSNITPPEDTNVVVRVFFNLPDANARTSVNDPHYVGSFSFFEHAEHEGPVSSRSYALGLSGTLRNLQSVRRFEANRDTASFQLVSVPIHGDETSATVSVAKASITYR